MEIPKKLYNYEEEIFTHCITCNKELIETNQQYVIEKVIRRYPALETEEVIYEYAMCLNCAMKQKESLSEESLKAMEKYMSNFGNLMKNMQEKERDSCVLFGTPVEEMNEYMVQGFCYGKSLMPNTDLLVFGEEAINEMSELLSEKTRDEMDGFIDNHFGGPPEFKKLLKDVKVYV